MLYLDLDGVFADFDAQLLNYGVVNDKTFYHNPKNTHTPDQLSLRERVEECMRTEGFWENLPMCPNSLELWDYCQQLNPVILTALPNLKDWDERVKTEKQNWINKHFGESTSVIYCLRSEKVQYAKSLSDVLVDDNMQNIKEWNDAGGLGLFHTNSFDSINKLNQLRDHYDY